MIRHTLLLLLLYSQVPVQTPEEELDEARQRLVDGPRTMLITVRAQYGDGTPARGYIHCDGTWCKFDERPICGQNLPFATDSRGACGFNPSYEYLEEGMVCHATAGTRSGSLAFTPETGKTYIILIPGDSPTLKK